MEEVYCTGVSLPVRCTDLACRARRAAHVSRRECRKKPISAKKAENFLKMGHFRSENRKNCHFWRIFGIFSKSHPVNHYFRQDRQDRQDFLHDSSK
ncbi:MAG: hypothetical protein EOM20_15530 [Spartobacteria bacterium]|nr:hypothetical protein [Spartobacteria bacterium]